MSTIMNCSPGPRIVFGSGCIEELPIYLKEFNTVKPLICYDEGTYNCGAAPKVIEIVKSAGYEPIFFDQVEPEPSVELIDKMRDFALENGVDLFIGVGGGSVLDATKAAAFMCKHEGSTEDWMLDIDITFAGIPVISIPTNSGTGSESSYANVLSNHKKNIKAALVYPASLGIVDPLFTLTCPAHITALCGMDALSHACEALTSKMANPKVDLIATAAIQKITKWLPFCYHNLDDLKAREEMSLAANLAGQAFNETFVNFCHAMAETLGPYIHKPHGMICALSLPATMEYVGECSGAKNITKVADAMGIDVSDIADDGTAIGLRVADAMRDIMHEIKIPSYKDHDVSRDELLSHAKEMLDNFHMGAVPAPVTEEIAAKFIARSYDGYLEA